MRVPETDPEFPVPSRQAAKRIALRARHFSASRSRFFGGAEVTSPSSNVLVAAATSTTARSNASVLDRDGFVEPLTFRTY